MRRKENASVNFLLGLFAAGLLLSGCSTAASSYRDNPDFERRLKRINSIVVLPTHAHVYQLDAGGIKEEFPEWSEEAARHLNVAVQNEFQTWGKVTIKLLSEKDLTEAEKSTLRQTHALFEAVETSVFLHTYGPSGYRFSDKILDFDYSLGSDVRALNKEQADALLLIQGIDHQWTGGRKALQTLGVIVGVGAAVATGVLIIPVLEGGTMIKAALVDAQTGTLWWYTIALARAGYDLRDPTSVTSLVRELFKDYPTASPSQASASEIPER
jgi:hypothetical protein